MEGGREVGRDQARDGACSTSSPRRSAYEEVFAVVLGGAEYPELSLEMLLISRNASLQEERAGRLSPAPSSSPPSLLPSSRFLPSLLLISKLTPSPSSLHFLRDHLQARIALLEGERRSAENLKLDLSRRVKMLEFALRQER